MSQATAKENIISLEVASPQELNERLAAFAEEKTTQPRFIALNVYGPQVLVRQFDLPALKINEIKQALKLEAMELLHLKVDEIEFEHQVLGSFEGRTKGVFVAMPKQLLQEYVGCFRNTAFIPVKMTASILTVVDAFLHTHKIENESFCLMAFASGKRIQMAVSDSGQWVLIREINYENEYEAEQEVLNSIKYSCAKSANKELHEFYFSSSAQDREGLMERLQKELNIRPHREDAAGINGLSFADSLFKINLINKYAVTLPLRNTIIGLQKLAIAIVLLCCIVLGIRIMKNNQLLTKTLHSFTQDEYNQASGILEKLNPGR